MNLDDPWMLFSGLLIGLVGMGFFLYGKKQQDYGALLTGMALCVFPYFVGSLVLTWLIAAGCVGGLWAWHRYAG